MGDAVMKDKIEVLDISMDCMTAKETMLKTMQFMENDSVDTIEIVTMDSLMNNQGNEIWREQMKEFKLTLPGEVEILKAADVHDRIKLKETENRVFLKMFLKYLQKKQKRIYLLADTEEEIIQVENAIRHYNRGMRLSGHACLHPDDNREKEVVNEINGTETDCVLSVLSSPYQESFISRYRTLLNTKLWFGCGALLSKSYNDRMFLQRIRHFFRKTMFRRRVEMQQKEK